MRAAAIRRWWLEREAGRSALLMAPTNHAVDELNHSCQLVRIGEGQLDPNSPSVQAGAHTIYVGDEIATRDNDRRLLTDRGRMVRNRAEWTVTAIHPDRSISAEGRSGRIRLPAEYVAEHVDLAYARTGAGAQGRTVDVAILYLDGPTDVRNLYVPMNRGRTTNEVFVATTGEQTALDVVAQSIAADWIDRPALVRQTELDPHTTPDATISHSRQILAEWRGGSVRRTPADRLPGHDERSHSRRILDHWQRRDVRPTTNDHRATEPARLDGAAFASTPDHVDSADVSTPNEELRRQLRQLRAGRQRPSFGPEIEL